MSYLSSRRTVMGRSRMSSPRMDVSESPMTKVSNRHQGSLMKSHSRCAYLRVAVGRSGFGVGI